MCGAGTAPRSRNTRAYPELDSLFWLLLLRKSFVSGGGSTRAAAAQQVCLAYQQKHWAVRHRLAIMPAVVGMALASLSLPEAFNALPPDSADVTMAVAKLCRFF